MPNFIYIATSLDGFIARQDGSIDWLNHIENPEGSDYGYQDFISEIDAVVMGRGTYEMVVKFGIFPYTCPVFVLSTTLKQLKAKAGKVTVLSKDPPAIVKELNSMGYRNLYVDGGKTIQGFLHFNLIDEMIITKIPVLLGSGIPLFGRLDHELKFRHIETIIYKNGLVKSHYEKISNKRDYRGF